MKKNIFLLLVVCYSAVFINAQQKANDATAPLHSLQPNYPIPYNIPDPNNVKNVLDKIYSYLDTVTPTQLINRNTGIVVADRTVPDTNIIFNPGDFRLTSYEWGVAYSGMLLASAVTGDK